MVETSIKTEKAVVLTGVIGTAVTGYLYGIGRPLEAVLAGAISAAIVAFWSEGVNTKQETKV